MTKKDEEKIFAFLCYLISIVGVIIVLATKRERGKFSVYHAKQGLVLFITWIFIWIAATLLAVIPVFGVIISTILWILMVLLWIIGMINSLSERKVPLPIIGGFAKSFKF